MTTLLDAPPVEAEPLADEELAPIEPAAGPGGLALRRAAAGVLLTTLAAAVMTGGIFLGPGARVIASLTGAAGVALAAGASRLKGAVTANLALVLGVAVIGLAAMLPSGLASPLHVAGLVRLAAHEGSVLRPPVTFLAGWHAIVGWLMATVGMVAGWTAFVLRRPITGLLLPLPLAVVAGISIPAYAQVASGVVVVALIAAALAVVATGQLVGEDHEQISLGFQIRRAGRSIVVIAVISAALVAAARANFLFPKPIYNPSTQAQLPHVVPPSNAPNRPLFLVRSASIGPYRVGDLDVYDGNAWRFAPVADSQLTTVPRSGVVVSGVPTGVTADITIEGYTGTVLPSLYGLAGIVATGPTLAYDARSNTIQVSQGQIAAGFHYTIAAAGLPSIAALRSDVLPLPPNVRQFLAAPPVPPQIANLLSRLRAANNWDTFVALRKYVLDTVTAQGPGIPVPVSPTRVQELLFGSKEGSPYEATAAIALLSRWAGIPARIGFGFQADPTAKQGDAFVIRPRDAISYPEVYFPVYGWLPVTGLPKHASANDTNTQSNRNPNVLPSTNFGVQLALPILTPPPSRVASVVLDVVGLLLLLALLGGIGYVSEPAIAKSIARSRRRVAARAAGPRSRVALAYAEWRDTATDFGYRHDADTPLAFLARFAPDEEHRELAWLVTRSVWGDLRTEVTDSVAEQAEELSRALRARLAAAHPVTLRVLAALSRLSLRHPYAPDLYAELASKRKEGSGVPAPATQLS